MLKILIFTIILVLWLSTCNEKKDLTNKSNSSTIEDNTKIWKTDSVRMAETKRPETEDDFLMIINYIPLNSRYEFVKQVLPEISDIEHRHRGYIAQMDITIFNKNIKLEFIFSGDVNLYRIGFILENLNYTEADSLYKELQKFYSNKFGKYKEEINKDPGSSGYPIFHGSYWKSIDFDVVVGLNELSEDCLLNWGYQKKR